MWFAVFIPPVLVIAILAIGFIMWQRANLRSKEFSLPDKVLREFSIDGALPDQVLLELSIKDVKPMVDLMTSRLAWFATATAFFVASLSGILVSVIVILEMRSDYLSRSLIIGLPPAIAILMYLGFRLLRAAQQNKNREHNNSHENKRINQKNKQYSGPLFLDQLLNRTSGKVVPLPLIGFFNGLAFVGIAFIVGGSCSVIASQGRSPDEVSRQINDLGMLLYAGAALLITMVLEINQLHRWSGNIVSEDVRPEIHRAAAVMAGSVGVLFSLMLGATYLPALGVLQSRAIPVNLSIGSSLQNAFQFAVVLSPLVAGLGSRLWNSSSWPTHAKSD